jgi:predicted NBD/HSP70 family sugar kinase
MMTTERTSSAQPYPAAEGSPERAGYSPAGQNLVHAADHNLRVTLEGLRRTGSMSRLELAKLTGLTVPGITNIVRKLVADGLVREETAESSRANRFGMVAEGAVALGIDVSDDVVRLIAIDLAGQVIFRSERSVEAGGAAWAVIELASEALERLADQTTARVMGVGLTALDSADAVRAALAPLPVIVEPDTIAAALGERQFGIAEAGDSFVYLLLGAATRAGMIIGGSVFNGVDQMAGRVGSMRTGEDGRLLDQVASTAALWGLEDEGADHPEVERWVEETSAHLMDSIIAISAFIAPRDIYVGGRLPPEWIDALVQRLGAGRQARMVEPTQPYWLPEIARGSLAQDAVLLGIAAMPFLEFLLPDPRRPFRP